MKKTLKIAFSIIYIVGATITLILSIIFLLRCKMVLNPEAMLPMQLYEQAFIGLSVGAIPMLAVCYAVYHNYDIRNSIHVKRNGILIFIPGIICSCCAVVGVGIIVIGMFRTFVLH